MPFNRVSVFFFTVFFLLFNQSYAQNKVLFLIIAHDDKDYYVAMQKTWRSYMNIDPEHVKAYFVKANPRLKEEAKIIGDTIWTRTYESYIPGCMDKTILAMKHINSKLSDFDYVIRTNVSSVFVFSRLFAFLDTLPKQNLYCGLPLGWPSYASGAGIILSSDLAQLMVKNMNELFNKHPIIDDILISQFFIRRGINLIPCKQMVFTNIQQWETNKDFIPNDIFHFKTKNDREQLRLSHDILVQSELVKKFYGI